MAMFLPGGGTIIIHRNDYKRFRGTCLDGISSGMPPPRLGPRSTLPCRPWRANLVVPCMPWLSYTTDHSVAPPGYQFLTSFREIAPTEPPGGFIIPFPPQPPNSSYPHPIQTAQGIPLKRIKYFVSRRETNTLHLQLHFRTQTTQNVYAATTTNHHRRRK